MKSIYKILAALVIICTVSCKKDLHKTPIGILTEGVPPTHASILYSVSSSYQLLSSTLNIIGNWGWDDGTVLRNDFIMQVIASGDLLKNGTRMVIRHGWINFPILVLLLLIVVSRGN